jgi:ribosomal protein L37AE/L43A
MEHRECQRCGIQTQHKSVERTEQAIDWTVFVCSEMWHGGTRTPLMAHPGKSWLGSTVRRVRRAGPW